MSYLWRDATPRERAVAMFGKLRVWDTEHNNGVLIYLLLAEHAIEIVADRGLASRVPPDEWQAIVARMGPAFREQPFRGRPDAGAGRSLGAAGGAFPATRRAGQRQRTARPSRCWADERRCIRASSAVLARWLRCAFKQLPRACAKKNSPALSKRGCEGADF